MKIRSRLALEVMVIAIQFLIANNFVVFKAISIKFSLLDREFDKQFIYFLKTEDHALEQALST